MRHPTTSTRMTDIMLGCFFRLLLLPVIIAVLYPLMLLRGPFPTLVFPAEGAEVTAVIAGFALWWSVISLIDRRSIAAPLARINSFGLRDGEEAVAAGSIRATGDLLRAPFKGAFLNPYGSPCSVLG